MKKIKKLLRLFVASVCLCTFVVQANAADAVPKVTFLFSNGEKASFAFADKPEIAVTADGLTISSTGTSAVSYAFTDVERFYFEDVDEGAGVEKTSVSSKHVIFNYVDGVVIVSGMAAGERLAAVTLSGSLVNAAKADAEGNASIDLSSMPAGVYIVSTGSGVSFKLLKK